MRALTLTQPDTALAYLAGVIHGDGWLTPKSLGMKVKDRDFAQAFADSLRPAFGLVREPRADGPYWRLFLGNLRGRFNRLHKVSPQTDVCCAAWLRGMFDSEGNAQLTLHRHVGPASYSRRIAMYSTEHKTLALADGMLGQLGIRTLLIRATKNSAGHLGSKTVYELGLSGSRENYERFAALVGSSIHRKRVTMKAIVASYKPDLSAHCREIQLRGAKTKTARTTTKLIPIVVEAIRQRVIAGTATTQRACASAIAGYHTARNHMTHRQLVAAAKAGAPFVV